MIPPCKAKPFMTALIPNSRTVVDVLPPPFAPDGFGADNRVRLEPVRSAEPPSNSGSTGARAFDRVLRGLASGDGFGLPMIFSSSNWQWALQLAGSSPATRRGIRARVRMCL